MLILMDDFTFHGMQISCLQFSTGLEAVWAGETDVLLAVQHGISCCLIVTHKHAGSTSGGLYTLHCQAALQRYACVRAHEGRIHDMRPMGDGVLSLSSDRWRYHSAGGLSKLTFMDSEVSSLESTCQLHKAKTLAVRVCHLFTWPLRCADQTNCALVSTNANKL